MAPAYVRGRKTTAQPYHEVLLSLTKRHFSRNWELGKDSGGNGMQGDSTLATTYVRYLLCGRCIDCTKRVAIRDSRLSIYTMDILFSPVCSRQADSLYGSILEDD